jgi:PleD family two-component response regulator
MYKGAVMQPSYKRKGIVKAKGGEVQEQAACTADDAGDAVRDKVGQRWDAVRRSRCRDAKSNHLLGVDDEPAIRELLTFASIEKGLQVETAVEGYAALAYIAAHRPTLVLPDLGLCRFCLVRTC